MSGQATPLLPDDLAVNAEFIMLSREFDSRVVADTIALDNQMVSGSERPDTVAQRADVVVTDAVASKVNRTVNASGFLRRRVGTAVAGFAATTASLLIGGNVANAADHPPHDPNSPPCDVGYHPDYPSWEDYNTNGLVGRGEVVCWQDEPATTTTVEPATTTTAKPPTPTTVKPATTTTVKPATTTATPTTLVAVAESTPTSIEGTSTSSTDISTSTSLEEEGTTSSEADDSTSSSSTLPGTSTTELIAGAGTSVNKGTGWFEKNLSWVIPGSAVLLLMGGVLVYIRRGRNDEAEGVEVIAEGVDNKPKNTPSTPFGTSGSKLPPVGGNNLGLNTRSRTELN